LERILKENFPYNAIYCEILPCQNEFKNSLLFKYNLLKLRTYSCFLCFLHQYLSNNSRNFYTNNIISLCTNCATSILMLLFVKIASLIILPLLPLRLLLRLLRIAVDHHYLFSDVPFLQIHFLRHHFHFHWNDDGPFERLQEMEQQH